VTTAIYGRHDAVVIGAGPSGLAVAYELEHKHAVETLVIDRAEAPAISWRTRYDNFRLNSGSLSCPSWWADNAPNWRPQP